MNLIIDIGNTNVVLGIFKNDLILKKWRVATKTDNTAEDYFISIKDFFIENNFVFNYIAISSVVPKLTKVFYQLCKKFFNIVPFFVNQENSKIDIKVKSNNIGSDRLANIAASIDKFFGKDLLIIDIGTATTFDLVDKNGVYYGGIISPGPDIIIRAFSVSTALLPSVTFNEPKNVVGDDLISAMESGIFWGYISLIEGMITKIKFEKKKEIFVIGTGGFIETISPKIPFIDYSDIDLTLFGINVILKYSITQ